MDNPLKPPKFLTQWPQWCTRGVRFILDSQVLQKLIKSPKMKFPINFTIEFWHTKIFFEKLIILEKSELFFPLKMAKFSEIIYCAQKTAFHHYKQVSLWSGWIWSIFFHIPKNGLNPGMKNYEFCRLRVPMWAFLALRSTLNI